MKFVNIRADGSVCDTMAGVVLPYNERTAPVYEMIKSSLRNPRPRTRVKGESPSAAAAPDASAYKKEG